jgi:PKD domain
MKNWYLLLILLFILSSCKELESPVSTVSNNVFYLKGTIDNIRHEFIAGESLTYHYTSHNLDDKKVYEYISEFKSQSCPSCDDQLKITIRANKTAIGNEIDITEALGNINYNYLDNVVLPRHRTYRFKVDTLGIPSGLNSTFSWNFGDGTISKDKEPIHTYKSDGLMKVGLEYTNSNCTTIVVKDLRVFADTLPAQCYVDFKYTINGTQVSFIPSDTAYISAILWDFGDGNTSTTAYPTHNYQTLNNYNVSLYLRRDFLACEYNVMKQVGLAQSNCKVEFNYSTAENQVINDSLNLSKVLVEYTNADGEYYRSDLVSQENETFMISELEPYLMNEKSEKTIRFSLNFTCELQNEIGKRLKFESFNGKVGVSYP